MKRSHNFRELIIWKNAIELVMKIYSLTANLPDTEKFGFVSQMNRCAVSIPSNIAEGSGRTSEKEFVHFLRIAISSSYELETQLILAHDLFNLETAELLETITTLQNQIGAFIRKINTDEY